MTADRTGADLIGVTRARSEIERTAEGTDDVIRKSRPGGWSQRRYQQRAEDSWERNAQVVAGQTAALAGRIQAELIFAAGDVRALGYLRQDLPEEWRSRLIEVSGGRGADGSDGLIRAHAEAEVAKDVALRTEAALARLRQELGQGDLGCEGVEPTVQALAAAQVEMLLLAPGPSSDREAWFGPEPLHLATDRDRLDAMGARPARRAPLADVAVRAAIGSGATVLVLPNDHGDLPVDGIGAILRWK